MKHELTWPGTLVKIKIAKRMSIVMSRLPLDVARAKESKATISEETGVRSVSGANFLQRLAFMQAYDKRARHAFLNWSLG